MFGSATCSGIHKMLMRQQKKDVMRSKFLLRFPGTRDIRYFQTKLFLTSRPPFLITFTTKSYLRSEKHT